MAVNVNVSQSVQLAEGSPIARVEPSTGEIMLWPGGVGRGPLITMKPKDWRSICASVEAALRVVHLDGYTACEHGAES